MKTVIRLQFGIVAIEGFIQFKRAVSLYSSLILFPVAPALWIGIASTNRRSAGNLGQQDETGFPFYSALRIQDMNIHNANSIGADVFIS